MNKGIKTKYGKPLLEWEDLECYIKKLEQENEQLKDQLQQKENIIKEVREYIENNTLFSEDYDYDEEDNLKWNGAYDYKEREELLEILDKENI